MKNKISFLVILSISLIFIAFSNVALSLEINSGAPYSLPVEASAVPDKVSPDIDPAAPYSPTVMKLLDQLLPSDRPTKSQLTNASSLITGGMSDQGWNRTVGNNYMPYGLNSSGEPTSSVIAGVKSTAVYASTTLAMGNTVVSGGDTVIAAPSATIMETAAGATSISVMSGGGFQGGPPGGGGAPDGTPGGMPGGGGPPGGGMPGQMGAGQINVNSFSPGQSINIGTGADLESAVIACVASGAQNSINITLKSPLTKKHSMFTSFTVVTPPGSTTISVEKVAGFAPGQTIAVDEELNLETCIIKSINEGPNGAAIVLDSALKSSHSGPVSVKTITPAGSKALKVNTVAEFASGEKVYIDSGDRMESAVISEVGTAGAGGTGINFKTALTKPHNSGAIVRVVSAEAGDRNIKVSFITPFSAGEKITIDTGKELETATITRVGTAGKSGTGIDLLAPLKSSHYAGATVIKPLASGAIKINVESVSNFKPGDNLLIDSGKDQETAAIREIGTEGAGGTGITLEKPLTRSHANGAAVSTVYLPGMKAVRVESVNNFESGQKVWIDYPSGSGNPEQVVVKSVGTPGPTGTGIEFTSGLTQMHRPGAVIALLTTPTISPLSWADAQGILINSGPNAGLTTAPMELLGLAATFDRHYANLWGQVQGREGRQLMVTGLLGPQIDLDIFTNWQRAVNSSSGEDPFLGYEMAAAQVNGMQGVGLMSQVKHFGPYDGTNENKNSILTDQALHEMRLVPFEGAFVGGKAAAGMSSYHLFQDSSRYLNFSVDALIPASPYLNKSGNPPKTWPLNEAHWSSEQPMILNYTLRYLWGANSAIIGPDYGGEHSSSQILQGMDFSPNTDYYTGTPRTTVNETSSTCRDSEGNQVPCDTPGAVRVTGIPGPGCPESGCGIVDAVANGTLSLAVFKQSLVRMLYQQERFGLLGCASGDCANPGGVGKDRTGNSLLPTGDTTGTPVIGTKNGDAAVVELGAEHGGVLLKNEDKTLPIKNSDLKGGIFITGANAEINIAAPTNEAARGFPDRDAVTPLLQLKAMSGNTDAFTYIPALDPTGKPVPASVLSPFPSNGPPPSGARSETTGGLQRSSGTDVKGLAKDRIDPQIEYTTISGQGQLERSMVYSWDGWIYVPAVDTYTFRFQHSATVPDKNITFSLDGITRDLVAATSFYNGYYYGMTMVPVSPTVDGYVQGGLINRQFSVPTGSPLSKGWHRVTITFDNTGISNNPNASLRFAYSRTDGDIADAAESARGKAMAIVFANDSGRQEVNQNQATSSTIPVPSLPASQIKLIKAVAAANPNTVVVLNDGMPVIVNEWIDDVKAVLEMWNPGQEGGTATARLLLGHANPSGRLPVTWPLNATDAIHIYNEPADGLYPGSTAGVHPERLNGAEGGTSIATQGIYTGYRYFDKLNIPVRYPFGYGLSYTSFEYSNLSLKTEGNTIKVTFTVKNKGDVKGAAVPQVYVGPAKSVPEHVQQSVRSLRGFERVELKPGESKQVSITLDERSFQYWDEQKQLWVTASGSRTIWVGESSRDLKLTGDAGIK